MGQLNGDGRPLGLGFSLRKAFGIYLLKIGWQKRGKNALMLRSDMPYMVVALMGDHGVTVSQKAPQSPSIVYTQQFEIELQNLPNK